MAKRFTQFPNDVLVAKDIDKTDKLVYCAIKSFCVRKNECFPSTELLGKMLGVTRRTISKSVTSLAKNGYIVRTIHRGQSNCYKMLK